MALDKRQVVEMRRTMILIRVDGRGQVLQNEDISLRWVGYRGLVLGLLLIALVFVAPGGLARGLSTVGSAVRALPYSRQFRGSGDDG